MFILCCTCLLKRCSRLQHFSQSGDLKARKTWDLFFWLIFLISFPLSMTTLRFLHSSSMNTTLSKSSKFPLSSISIPLTTFWLSYCSRRHQHRFRCQLKHLSSLFPWQSTDSKQNKWSLSTLQNFNLLKKIKTHKKEGITSIYLLWSQPLSALSPYVHLAY